MKQAKVNYPQVKVKIPNVNTILKQKKATSVTVVAKQYYNGKRTYNKVVLGKRALTDFKSSGSKTLKVNFNTFGKFKASVYFYKGSKKVYSKTYTVNVVASQYNIVSLNGTYPVLTSALSLWSMDIISNSCSIRRIIIITKYV